MGVPSGNNQSAYITAEDVMNRARAFVNDAFRGGAGRILTDTAPFTTEYLNAALEELQDELGNSAAGIILLQDNILLSPIPPLPNPDPSVQVSIGYNGISSIASGVPPIPAAPLPRIPANIITVEKLWERQLGSGLPFQEMTTPMQNLGSILQGAWLYQWEYRQDAIWLTGSTQVEELRMRGMIRQIPIAAADSSDLDGVQISILASTNALATLVAYNYARARGAAQAQLMQADAKHMTRLIKNRYSRRAQGIQYNRRSYGEAGDRRWVRLPF